MGPLDLKQRNMPWVRKSNHHITGGQHFEWDANNFRKIRRKAINKRLSIEFLPPYIQVIEMAREAREVVEQTAVANTSCDIVVSLAFASTSSNKHAVSATSFEESNGASVMLTNWACSVPVAGFSRVMVISIDVNGIHQPVFQSGPSWSRKLRT